MSPTSLKSSFNLPPEQLFPFSRFFVKLMKKHPNSEKKVLGTGVENFSNPFLHLFPSNRLGCLSESELTAGPVFAAFKGKRIVQPNVK